MIDTEPDIVEFNIYSVRSKIGNNDSENVEALDICDYVKNLSITIKSSAIIRIYRCVKKTTEPDVVGFNLRWIKKKKYSADK